MPADDHDAAQGHDSRLAFTLRYAVPGLLGATVLAIGAIGVGWLPFGSSIVDIPVVHTLRTTDVGLWASRASVILGGALLLQSWLVVGMDIMHGHLRDVRRLWGVLAVWCLPLMFVPPIFSRDVYSYFAQGKLVQAGVDPYTSGVSSIPGWFQDGVDPMWGETPTPYGPFFLALSRGVASLVGDNPVLAAFAFRLLAVAGIALMAYYLPRLAFHHGIDGSKALWLGVMNPLVLMHFVAGIHNDALMIGLLIAGLTLAIESKPITGILLITAASAIKPIAFLALPFVGLIWAGTTSTFGRRVRLWFASAGISAVTFLGMSAVVGVGFGWINALSTPGAVRTWLSPATALGMLTGMLGDHLGLGDHVDGTVAFFRTLGTLAALVIIAWLCLRPEGRTPVRGAMLAFLAVVTLGPVIQPWYLLWALPLAAASGLRPRELRVVVLLIAGFTLYGLCETSATADNLLELSDGLAMLAAAGAVLFAVLASPRERALVMGDQVSHGLLPEDQPARARLERIVVRGA